MIGRYPDFDVFDAVSGWDVATRRVVIARLVPPGPLRFFTSAEEPTLRAFCDTVLAQDGEPRIPVAEMVDDKLADGRLDGYRYADLPRDTETWRLVLHGLDHTAKQRFELSFADVGDADREEIVGAFAAGRLSGGPWHGVNVARAWSVVMRAALAAFYSHPWSWNEIGFGGPAYPRGFMRLGGPGSAEAAGREPFETPGAFQADPVRDAAAGNPADPGEGSA